MKTDADNTPSKKGREESDGPAFDFWSDEGARRFNEILDEGSAYLSTGVLLPGDPEGDLDDDQFDYIDPDLE